MGSYTLGLVYILTGAILWSGTAVIVQYLCGQYDFTSPFLITYVGSCLFIFLIHPSLAHEIRLRGDKITAEMLDNKTETLFTSSSEYDDEQDDEANENSPLVVRNYSPKAYNNNNNNNNKITDENVVYDENSKENTVILENDLKKRIVKQHLIAAIQVAPMWWMSNYFYNYSLSYTTITSSTITSNMGCVFTFLFALGIGQEKYSTIKLLGVLLVFLGSLLTTLDSVSDTSTAEVGDFAGLLCSLGHACYSVVVRKVNPTDNCLNMSLLLGFVGLLLMLLLGPYAIFTITTSDLFKASDIETSMIDQRSFRIFVWLIGKGLFGNILPDLCWGNAIILTNATIATVGLNIMIPLALFSDTIIMHRNVMNFDSILGAILVVLGFVLVN